MSAVKFAIILQEHRVWGTILSACLLKKNPTSEFYNILEYLGSNDEYDNFEPNISQQNAIQLIDEYSEQQLFKLYSKNKNIKEFTEKLDKERLESLIRPFIEKRMHAAFDIIAEHKIPIFLKDKKFNNLYPDDEITIETEKANPLFIFSKSDEQSTYTLSVESKGKKIRLNTRKAEVISNTPAILRIDKTIFFIDDIEGKKLKPFFTKEHILIPKQSEKKYFESFVLNAVKSYPVEANGFEIRTISPARKAILSLEENIQTNPVLLLKFRYDDCIYMANNKSNAFVSFEDENGHFVFNRIYRDLKWEHHLVHSLKDLGLLCSENANFEFQEKGDKDSRLYELINWINTNYTALLEAGFEIRQNHYQHHYYIKPYNLEINSKIEKDWFDIYATVEIGDFKIPFIRFKRYILNHIKEFELPNGELFILPEEWFANYKSLFEFGDDDDDNIKVHKQHFSLISSAMEGIDQQAIEKLEKLSQQGNIPNAGLPQGIKATLRPYQLEGYTWMRYLHEQGFGGCLADDMGLGKTLQTITLLQWMKEDYKNNCTQTDNTNPEPGLFDTQEGKLTSLIVLPASLVHNWANELAKFAPELKFYKYIGQSRRKATSYFSYYDIILSSYHTVRQDIELLSTFKFHYTILDESQVIKNSGSQLYRAINQLQASNKLALTGTPIENSLTDLWSQLNFINKGLLGSLNFFKKEFVNPIEKKNIEEKEEKLQKIITPFILRRTKEEVAKDLPPVTEQVVYCNMTEEQRKIYDEEKSSLRNSIMSNIEEQGIEKSAIMVLQGLTRLRQIANHPVLANEDYLQESGKFNEIIRNIENIASENHKVLIFSSFVKHLELFEEEFEERKIKYCKLTGSTSNREEVVKNFQNNPANKVFLISLKAGGVGLNLTAADYVFILDPWWNPAAENQAIDRAHRIGQDKNVFVYRYISNNSIEEKIVKLQERKSELASAFINSNNPFKGMDVAQIAELFD